MECPMNADGLKIACFAGAVVAGLAFASHTQAAQIGGVCSATDITNISTGTLLGCAGSFSGNDNNNQGTVIPALSGISSGTWDYDTADKSDASGNGVFTSNPGSNAGTLTFDTSMFGIFAVALKTANFYSLYVFDGGASGIGSFDYTTVGVSYNSNNGNGAGLSHASFYSCSDCGNGGTGTGTAIAEPAALGLFGLGLVGLGLAARRRRTT